MARSLVRHRCLECGTASAKWVGRCTGCGAWNTVVEEARPVRPATAGSASHPAAAAVPLVSVDMTSSGVVATGVAELDRVLGGGVVPGSVTLLGGEPGIGKSTLLLQVLAAGAAAGRRVLLVSAEESAQQVRLRAERLGPVPADLLILAATSLDDIEPAIVAAAPDLVVIDSIQSVSAGDGPDGTRQVPGPPGSVAQVRECADRLVTTAKATGTATVLVGHVTKDGALAGPRTLEHVVDTVLSFEGDRHHGVRLLRALKHRFGPTGELGLFEMGDTGLTTVDDPGRLLLGDRLSGVPGGTVVAALQGRRTLVVELQALVTRGTPPPKRSVVGLDPARLSMTLAVLKSRAGVEVLDLDVYVSVAGGVRVVEPGADLAVALAVASATLGRPLPDDMVAVGEVGLAGEVRQVADLPRRLEESARCGFRRAMVPRSAPPGPAGVELHRVDTVAEAIGVAGLALADGRPRGRPAA